MRIRSLSLVASLAILAAPGTPPMDIHLDDLVAVGGGWLATKCSFYINGVRNQLEEYSGWQANEALPASLFDVTQWSTGPHWAKGGQPG